MTDILHEWTTVPVDCEAWRKMEAFGISWENLNRCGGPLPVRVRTDGSYFEPSDPDGTIMLMQPVYAGPIPSIYDPVESPCLADMISYSPRGPGRWYWRRGEHAIVLGDEHLERAELFHEQVRLYRTPFDWLRAGGDGVCLLDRHPNAIDRLRHVGAINAADIGLGTEIERLLRSRRLPSPRINVLVGQGVAA